MNYVDEFRSMADGKTTINLADELGRTTLDAIASVCDLESIAFHVYHIHYSHQIYIIDRFWNESRQHKQREGQYFLRLLG